MARILLATPAYGDMFYTPYVSSVIRLQRLLARDKHELIFAAISYADIVESVALRVPARVASVVGCSRPLVTAHQKHAPGIGPLQIYNRHL